VPGSALVALPRLDSVELASAARKALEIPRTTAATPGQSAVEASNSVRYDSELGRR